MALKPPKNNLFANRENRYGVMWNKCGKFLNGKSRIIERGTDQEIRRRFFFLAMADILIRYFNCRCVSMPHQFVRHLVEPQLKVSAFIYILNIDFSLVPPTV